MRWIDRRLHFLEIQPEEFNTALIVINTNRVVNISSFQIEMTSKRTSLTLQEKRVICEFSKKWPSKSQQQIAYHFSNHWSKPIKRQTVGDILHDKRRWEEGTEGLSDTDMKKKKSRTGKHSKLEKALFLWFTSARAKNITVTQDILREKAKQFGEQLGIDSDFLYSFGWINRFKRRFGISNRKLFGESASVDPEFLERGISEIRDVIKDYAPCDVFNMDETGLFFSMIPDRSLTTKDYISGSKKLKSRISVALCSNSDGSEKCRVLVIGKSKRP